MRRGLIRYPILFLGLLGVFGCDPTADFEGHYEGSLLRRENGKIHQDLVSADIAPGEKNVRHVQLTDLQQHPILQIDVTEVSSTELTIRIPGVMDPPLLLDGDDQCFTDQVGKTTRLCHGDGEIVIEIQGADHLPRFALILDRFAKVSPLAMETPATLTLREAMDRAFQMSFQTQLEYRRVADAKTYVGDAIGNLIPMPNPGSVGGLFFGGGILKGILGDAGDFLPFIFPNRWLRLKEVSIMGDAERESLTIMRLNTGNEAEALAYTLRRDEGIIQSYSKTLEVLQKIRDSLQKRQPSVSSDDLDDLDSGIENLQNDAKTADIAVKMDRIALSQALGFMNPNAVTDIAFDETALVDSEQPADENEIVQTAASRSFELRQLDQMVEAAKVAKIENFFTWLDPSDDPNLTISLGFAGALPPNEAKLTVQKKNLLGLLSQKAAQATVQFNDSLTFLQQAKALSAQQEARIQKLINAIENSSNIDTTKILERVRNYLQSQIYLDNTRAIHSIARAKIERLQLTGFYGGMVLLPPPGEMPNPTPQATPPESTALK